MSAGVSEVYIEEDERWLRVGPGHAISEWWLRERAADLYAQWQAAPAGVARDQLAVQIEARLEELESPGSQQHGAGLAGPPSAVTDRVARHENNAERLGAIALDDPARPAAHLAHQAEGDTLRDDLTALPSEDARDMVARRLDAADLVADRPFIEQCPR